MCGCARYGSLDFWILGTGQFRCKQCGLTRFPRRSYWQQSRISPYWKGRLLELFCFGVPVYHLLFQVTLNLKTIQRWYHVMRLCRDPENRQPVLFYSQELSRNFKDPRDPFSKRLLIKVFTSGQLQAAADETITGKFQDTVLARGGTRSTSIRHT